MAELSYFVPAALLRARADGAEVYARQMQRYFDLSVALAYAFAVPSAILAPWIVRLVYGSEYAAAAPVLAVHAWAALFVFLGVARGQFLVNEGRPRFGLAATVLGAAINIGLNWVLIPRAGALGAAWATVVSYAVAAWVSSSFHPAVRPVGMMQTRALLLPLTGWRYFLRS